MIPLMGTREEKGQHGAWGEGPNAAVSPRGISKEFTSLAGAHDTVLFTQKLKFINYI